MFLVFETQHHLLTSSHRGFDPVMAGLNGAGAEVQPGRRMINLPADFPALLPPSAHLSNRRLDSPSFPKYLSQI